MLPRNPTRKEKRSCLSPGPAATLPAPLLRSRWIVDRGDFWATVREFLSREEGSPGILEEGRRGHSRSIITKMENKTRAGNTTGTAALTTTLPSTHHRHIPPRSAQHMQRHDTTFSPKVTPMGGCLPYPDHPVPFWRLRPPSFFPTPPPTPPFPPRALDDNLIPSSPSPPILRPFFASSSQLQPSRLRSQPTISHVHSSRGILMQGRREQTLEERFQKKKKKGGIFASVLHCGARRALSRG